MDLLKDLDRFQPYQIKQMYNYKLTGLMEEEQEARNAEYEYKIGMMDPSREQALLNKANRIRRDYLLQKNKTRATFSKFQ